MMSPSLPRRALAPLVAAVLTSLSACEAAATPTTHTVVIDKMKFGSVPKNVRVGDYILWVNKDMFKHTATARDKSFNVDLPAKASGKTVVRKSGSIPFYCVYHPGMKGVLPVRK